MGNEKSNENMIYVYDVFTDIYKSDKLRLTPNELFLYCLLYRRRNYDQVAEISVETIHQMAPVKFYSSVESKNRRLIRELLFRLEDKGIISFDVEMVSLDSKKGNHLTMIIQFERFTDDGGYLRIPYSEFDTVENINHFYIRVAVERFNNVRSFGLHYGRWISEKEFGMLLDVSKRTFRNYADEMISRRLLFKVSGERQNSKEQDKNIYRTIPFDDGIDSGKKKYSEKYYPADLEIDTVIGQYNVADLKEYLKHCNWGKKNELGYIEITQDDYDAFRTCDELGIYVRKVESIKKTVENMKNYDKYGGVFEEFEGNYQRVKEELGIIYDDIMAAT